jgi:hypothetical protein
MCKSEGISSLYVRGKYKIVKYLCSLHEFKIKVKFYLLYNMKPDIINSNKNIHQLFSKKLKKRVFEGPFNKTESKRKMARNTGEKKEELKNEKPK